MKEPQKLVETEGLDLAMFGQRLKHARRAKGLTLADLGAKVGRTPSVLSLIENGKREPRLSLVEQLAAALGVPVTELLKKQPPSRRAQLEIALEQAQHDPSYTALGLPRAPGGHPRADRRARAPGRAGQRVAGAALQADRDPGGGPRRERRAALLAARARQLLRRDRAGGRRRPRPGRLRRRRAVAGHAAHRGRQARLLRQVRRRPAALGQVADRPARAAASTSSRSRSAATRRAP